MYRIPTAAEGVILAELSADDAWDYQMAYRESLPELSVFDSDAAARHTDLAVTCATLADCSKLRFGIYDGGIFAGSINAQARGDSIEVDCWVLSHRSGRGLATLATLALTGWLQSLADGDRRIFARVRAGNDGSRRVLEKAGFHPTYVSDQVLVYEAGFFEDRGQAV